MRACGHALSIRCFSASSHCRSVSHWRAVCSVVRRPRVIRPPMAKTSAGLLLYRRRADELEVFLVHPGGPFWAKKDLGAWSLPKGELAEGEEPLAAAVREF